jgi:hypothetical protein
MKSKKDKIETRRIYMPFFNSKKKRKEHDYTSSRISEVSELTTEDVNDDNLQSMGSTQQNARNKKWQKASEGLGVAAEVANVGIGIEVVGKLIPGVVAAAGGALSFVAFITDPLIYFFRACVRLTRVVGRKYFGITFEEEKDGQHKHQTAADIACIALFCTAIPLLLGVAAAIGSTVGWALAIAAVAINCHVDYGNQAKTAKEKYEALKADPATSPSTLAEAKKDHESKKKSYHYLIAVIVGLAFLFICGTAAVFAPPALVPILFFAAKAASAYLALINVARIANWAGSKFKKSEDGSDVTAKNTEDQSKTPSTTASVLASDAMKNQLESSDSPSHARSSSQSGIFAHSDEDRSPLLATSPKREREITSTDVLFQP